MFMNLHITLASARLSAPIALWDWARLSHLTTPLCVHQPSRMHDDGIGPRPVIAERYSTSILHTVRDLAFRNVLESVESASPMRRARYSSLSPRGPKQKVELFAPRDGGDGHTGAAPTTHSAQLERVHQAAAFTHFNAAT